MSNESNGQAEIKSIYSQFTKTFSVYDVQFRLITLYEAMTHAVAGAPCTKTTFQYESTSTRIAKTKEESDVWSLAYDI